MGLNQGSRNKVASKNLNDSLECKALQAPICMSQLDFRTRLKCWQFAVCRRCEGYSFLLLDLVPITTVTVFFFPHHYHTLIILYEMPVANWK